MNESFENNLEQSKFERAAEKCSSHEDRIAFCKQYLKKHNEPEDGLQYDIASSFTGFIDNDYSLNPGYDIRKTTTLHVKKEVSNSLFGINRPLHAEPSMIRKHLVDQLMAELVKKYIVFEAIKNVAMDSIDFHAAIRVAKWKDE